MSSMTIKNIFGYFSCEKKLSAFLLYLTRLRVWFWFGLVCVCVCVWGGGGGEGGGRGGIIHQIKSTTLAYHVIPLTAIFNAQLTCRLHC